MKKELFCVCRITILILSLFVISCDKKEDPVIHELFGLYVDTLTIGESFTFSLIITLPPANVSLYLEGPLRNSDEKAGQYYFDNTSDSLYIQEDMILIHNVSTFEENEYVKKYWKIPSFTWQPSLPQVEGNQMYCFVLQGVWEKEEIPRMTIRNYFYLKEN